LKTTNWKDSAELIGIAAIVGSLIFVGLQMRQDQEIALNERSYTSLDGRLELNLSIVDHADIWTKGNAGESLDEVETAIFSKFVENQHWISWNSWRSARRFGLTLPEQLAIAEFAAYLHENPGAYGAWKDYMAKRESARRQLVDGYDANDFEIAVDSKLDALNQSEK